MTRMKDLYYDILEKAKSNTDSPYSVDSICAIRSFLLSLYLLSVLDESFFLESFKAFLDKCSLLLLHVFPFLIRRD
jgi:hypothetical protein